MIDRGPKSLIYKELILSIRKRAITQLKTGKAHQVINLKRK